MSPGGIDGGADAPLAVGRHARSELLLRDGVTVFVCVLIFILNTVFNAGNDLIAWAVLSVTLIYALYPHASTPMGVVAIFTGMTVFVVPLMAVIYVGEAVMPAWLGLYIIVVRVMIAFAPTRAGLKDSRSWAGGNLGMMAAILAAGLASQAIPLDDLFFHAAFGCSLINLERLHASTESKTLRWTGVALALTAILIYSLVFWDGYGRLVLTTFALAALMITVHYKTFRVPILLFVGFSAALVFVGRVLRFGVSEGVAGLAEDSGASPMTLTQIFWDDQVIVQWNEPFWHQWSLLFISWYPRAWWLEKPVGLNYTLVDVLLGREGLGDDHSTAVSFLGEQMFLHGDLWLLTTALIVGLLLLIIHAIGKLAAPYFAPVAMAQAWLLSFFWGGMAVYGSRIWFSVVPMLIYVIILRVIFPPGRSPLSAPGRVAFDRNEAV